MVIKVVVNSKKEEEELMKDNNMGLMEVRCKVCNAFIEYETCDKRLDGQTTYKYCTACIEKNLGKLKTKGD